MDNDVLLFGIMGIYFHNIFFINVDDDVVAVLVLSAVVIAVAL